MKQKDYGYSPRAYTDCFSQLVYYRSSTRSYPILPDEDLVVPSFTPLPADAGLLLNTDSDDFSYIGEVVCNTRSRALCIDTWNSIVVRFLEGKNVLCSDDDGILYKVLFNSDRSGQSVPTVWARVALPVESSVPGSVGILFPEGDWVSLQSCSAFNSEISPPVREKALLVTCYLIDEKRENSYIMFGHSLSEQYLYPTILAFWRAMMKENAAFMSLNDSHCPLLSDGSPCIVPDGPPKNS